MSFELAVLIEGHDAKCRRAAALPPRGQASFTVQDDDVIGTPGV
jgi:hypothetical protein